MPNLNDDMHDGTIAQGDTWLQTNIDAYAQWAKTHNSLLIVTWDEDDSSMSNQIPTIFYGAGVKAGQYSEHINHYNVLRTIEDMYGLSYAGNAASSTPITDVWSAVSGNTVTVANPGSQTTTVGGAASLQISATDSAAEQTLTYGATGLPTGLSINSSTGLISGTATATGIFNVAVTATDTTGATGSAGFTWTVNPQVTGGITNGGFETGNLSGWTAAGTAAVVNTGAHSGTYAAELGSSGPTATSSVAQTFTAPTGTSTLTVWYNVACTDTLKHDWATATLTDDTAATTTTVLPKTCTSGAGWKSVAAPVVVGHSYTLTLTNRDDDRSSNPGIATLFDDVTLA